MKRLNYARYCDKCGYDKQQIALCSVCMTRNSRYLHYVDELNIEYYRNESYINQKYEYVYHSNYLPYSKPTI